MSIIETIIIAIVEGLTEFLPVSSTGHMIIAQNLMGIESTDFVKAFTVIIQFGAILSVIVLYWNKFFRLNKIEVFDQEVVVGMSPSGKYFTYLKRLIYKFDFYWKLFIAFIPAAVLGLLFSKKIDELLENVFVVAVMLVLGGILMLFIDKMLNNPSKEQSVNWRTALKIGFFQCIAMIPGVSRSFATIAGGMSAKLNRKNAAEFSFFLAVPTMAAAAGYKFYKLIGEGNTAILKDNLFLLLIGNIVAFIVAIAAIKFFITFLTKHGFKLFGWYRIIVGLILIILLVTNVLSNNI